MKLTGEQVFGFESAIRGMRNPMNSWDKSDSEVSGLLNHIVEGRRNYNIEQFVLGQADERLSQKLTKAGAEHCKHLRMIQVWFDLDFPRYGWQELDTYKHMEKISCSTMHKMFDSEITEDDFMANNYPYNAIDYVVENLEYIKRLYEHAKQEGDVDTMNKALIDAKSILPESFLQLRTVNINYQQLLNIYYQRKNHRLPIWKEFCKWIEQLPYFIELTGIELYE